MRPITEENIFDLDRVLDLRHRLHAHPELSGQEFETAELIKSFLSNYHPTRIIDKIGGAGFAAIYEFSEKGKTIVIRCELDALPIHEQNNLPYRSGREGVSHKCGHDGHMAIVAGLACWLQNADINAGKVVLLFQPAEETGEGAYKVVHDERFQALGADYVFAMHNLPKQPLHSVIVMERSFSAEVESCVLTLHGKTSHAAEPEQGINPALAVSKMIAALDRLNLHDPTHDDFALVTPVHIKMGEKAYGISPGCAELHYTIRTWNGPQMKLLKESIKEVIQEESAKGNLTYKMEWLAYFPASVNDPSGNDMIRRAAKTNGYHIIEDDTVFKYGEDFGWFSKSYKTAMFGLGSGLDCPALHHATYDFPDDILETGINMFKSIILEVLSS